LAKIRTPHPKEKVRQYPSMSLGCEVLPKCEKSKNKKEYSVLVLNIYIYIPEKIPKF